MAGFRLGTRGSKLALAQANSVQEQLQSLDPGAQVEIVTIKTSGDRGHRDRLGAFVREIQEALIENRIDLALHCLKDLPTLAVNGLKLSAFLRRDDPHDALISRFTNLDDLPHRAVVGTGSVRRSSQLGVKRPDLAFEPLVGNVDTRLKKLMDGDYDAIVLAVAGLRRLGLIDNWAGSDYRSLSVINLSEEEMLPAPGQAVLVLETRETDPEATALAARLNDELSQAATAAERAFLNRFGGGCSVPVAALAKADGASLKLQGLVASPAGDNVIRGTEIGAISEAATIGLTLAERLGSQGGFALVEALTNTGGVLR